MIARSADAAPDEAPPTVARLAALAGLAAVAVVVLSIVGDDDLALPDLRSGAAISDWVDDVHPIIAVMTIVRLVALAMAWYLGICALLALAFRLAGYHRTAARMCPALARRAILGSVALGIAGTVITTGLVDHDPDGSTVTSPEPTPDPRPAESTVTTPVESASERPPGPVVGPDTAVPTMVRIGAAPVPTARPSDQTTPIPPTVLATWTIEPGDHLWRVAEETLSEARGRAVSDDEVVLYWRELIEHNRSRLVDPENPDLVVVGQVVELPEISRE